MRVNTFITATSITRAAGLTALFLAGTAPAIAADDVRTVAFARSGNWTISGVHDAKGFNHCAARVGYKNGIKVGLLGYFNGNWTLQFYRDDWAERPETPFDVRVDVDGRTVLTGKGKWSGRSAFVYLGASSERLAALMNGTLMTVVTGSGSTQFRLDGSAAAVKVASRCRSQQMAANPRSETPSTASNGAFGAPPASKPTPSAFAPPAATPKPEKLSRADTISFANAYLGRRGLKADLIAETENVMKHFPVNWRMPNGIVGGAMVLRGTPLTPAAAADRLIAEQGELCKGTVAAKNRSKAALPDGASVELASAQCTAPGESYSIVFQVTSPQAGLLVVIAELSTRKTRPIAGASAPAADEL
ncbi:MAG: hypothetical protein R3D27_04645 [Hyphomicrobiaceae bacterium]